MCEKCEKTVKMAQAAGIATIATLLDIKPEEVKSITKKEFSLEQMGMIMASMADAFAAMGRCLHVQPENMVMGIMSAISEKYPEVQAQVMDAMNQIEDQPSVGFLSNKTNKTVH